MLSLEYKLGLRNFREGVFGVSLLEVTFSVECYVPFSLRWEGRASARPVSFTLVFRPAALGGRGLPALHNLSTEYEWRYDKRIRADL